MSKLLTISEARNELADTVNRVAYTKQRVVIGRRGKRLVAVVPVEDLDRLERLDDEADARAARAAVRKRKVEDCPLGAGAGRVGGIGGRNIPDRTDDGRGA